MNHASNQSSLEILTAIDVELLGRSVNSLRMGFQSAAPFRHVVIDGFLLPSAAREAATLFPPYERMERVRDSVMEKRASESRLELLDEIFGRIFADLRARKFVSLVEEITGIEQLLPPNKLDGAGLHQARNGGFHNVHADKNIDPNENKFHRLSLIIYLNDGWQAGSSGALELWDRNMKSCVSRIEPLFNRCVIFEVHDRAYHGYGRLTLNERETRKSLAMWYLTATPGSDQTSKARPVKFYLRPTDGFAMRLKYVLREVSLKLPLVARRNLAAIKQRLPFV